MNESKAGMTPARKTSGSAARTLQLIQALAGHGRPMTLAQLADRLELPKATVHRLCGRLVEMRFLIRDLDERCYAIGPAMQRMAFDTLAHGTYSRLRHNVLVDLVADVGETCNFTTLDGASVLYLDRVEAQRPWRLTLSVGVHVPLHCTASGKLFLSCIEPVERRRLIGSLDLQPLTAKTITSVEGLIADVERIADHGYALETEEFVVGLIALAVPVHDREGRVRAAIAMHCPTSHANCVQAMSKLPSLQAAAARMRGLLEV